MKLSFITFKRLNLSAHCKQIYCIILISINYDVYADTDAVISSQNTNFNYISSQTYIQNPYKGLTSFGGTQNISESQILTQNIAEKWFAGGTWNVMGSASYVSLTGSNNYAYGANIFGQTGAVAGFSFGAEMSILNPFFANQMNPATPALQDQILPVAQQVTPHELFVEYQFSNIVQADLGYISISNSPWIATNYYPNYLNGITYQGGIVNLHPGGGWLITGVAFNAAQLIGENGFSGLTMYNQQFDYATGTANIANEASAGTFALGTSYIGFNNNYNLRIWAYQFQNYANLAYLDNSLLLVASNQLSFNLAAQGGIQNGTNDNVMANNGYGDISSNFIGAQAGLTYNCFGLSLGYNSIWGPQSAYAGGGLVSPYTYQLGTDPLYTTSWMVGMVEKSAGNAYKITPSLSLLDGNLTITPSYAYYSTAQVVDSSEYDFIINYNIPQIRGFNVYGGYGYIAQGYNPNGSGGSISQTQIRFNYLY